MATDEIVFGTDIRTEIMFGLTCQPVRFGHGTKGYMKYTATLKHEDSDSQSTCGFETLKEADEYMRDNPDVEKMVVYVYHPNSKTFEFKHYYGAF